MLFRYISLLAFVTITLSLNIERQGNNYCPCTNSGTYPCCGIGLFDLLCSECEDGCRYGGQTPSGASFLSQDASNLFAAADTNGDGKLTFAEWRDSPVCSSFKDKADKSLSEMWAKFDTNNVGYLTKEEVINRKSAT